MLYDSGIVVLQVCQTTIRGRITALAFSHLEEGEAANCVLIGTQAGLLRLYSSWDLTHIRDVAGKVPFLLCCGAVALLSARAPGDLLFFFVNLLLFTVHFSNFYLFGYGSTTLFLQNILKGKVPVPVHILIAVFNCSRLSAQSHHCDLLQSRFS